MVHALFVQHVAALIILHFHKKTPSYDIRAALRTGKTITSSYRYIKIGVIKVRLL